jgi:hypothetical protein
MLHVSVYITTAAGGVLRRVAMYGQRYLGMRQCGNLIPRTTAVYVELLIR